MRKKNLGKYAYSFEDTPNCALYGRLDNIYPVENLRDESAATDEYDAYLGETPTVIISSTDAMDFEQMLQDFESAETLEDVLVACEYYAAQHKHSTIGKSLGELADTLRGKQSRADIKGKKIRAEIENIVHSMFKAA